MVNIGHLNARLRKAILNCLGRKAGIVFLAGKAFLLNGRDYLAIMDQCRSTIVVVGRKPKNISPAHAAILYPVSTVKPAPNANKILMPDHRGKYPLKPDKTERTGILSTYDSEFCDHSRGTSHPPAGFRECEHTQLVAAVNHQSIPAPTRQAGF